MPIKQQPLSVKTVHVIYTDRVQFSLLSIEQQIRLSEETKRFLEGLPLFQAARDREIVFVLDTGDGMCLVFLEDPHVAAQIALFLNDYSLQQSVSPMRIGMHTGPVTLRTDISGKANASGPGIDLAARVMSCAEPGTVLCSRSMAEQLESFADFKNLLNDEGTREVKHAVNLHVFTLGDRSTIRRAPSAPTGAREPAVQTVVLKSRWVYIAGTALVVVPLVFIIGMGLIPHTTAVSSSSSSAPAISAASGDAWFSTVDSTANRPTGSWVPNAAWIQTFKVPSQHELSEVVFWAKCLKENNFYMQGHGSAVPQRARGKLYLFEWRSTPTNRTTAFPAGSRADQRVQLETKEWGDKPLAAAAFEFESPDNFTRQSVRLPKSTLQPGKEYALAWVNESDAWCEFMCRNKSMDVPGMFFFGSPGIAGSVSASVGLTGVDIQMELR